MTRRQAVGWLILVCLIWGASFTVIKETLALISPLLFMGLKFGLAAMLVIGSFRGGLILAAMALPALEPPPALRSG